MKKQITIVSFPRSGQHLTERLLKFYCKKQQLKFSYCEYYSHCNHSPCLNRRVFQKNHDFDLNLPIDSSQKYIVLYRNNMTAQLESWFRYYLKEQWNVSHDNKEIDYKNTEKRNMLIKFINSKTDYYVNFLKKWVYNSYTNIYKIEYNDLINNSENILQMFNFIFPDIDHKNDKKILNAYNKQEKITIQNTVDLTFNL